jgi:hypothetical protein
MKGRDRFRGLVLDTGVAEFPSLGHSVGPAGYSRDAGTCALPSRVGPHEPASRFIECSGHSQTGAKPASCVRTHAHARWPT